MAKNDFRVTSIFKIMIRICTKNVEFSRKTSNFLFKSCLSIFCIFYLNEKELNQQVCLIKYVENEISNSASHKNKKEKKKGREEQKHDPTSKTFLKLLKKTLVTNYHKLLVLRLVVRP